MINLPYLAAIFGDDYEQHGILFLLGFLDPWRLLTSAAVSSSIAE